MALVCALSLVGGNALRRSDSQAAIGAVKSHRWLGKVGSEHVFMLSSMCSRSNAEVKWVSSHPEKVAEIKESSWAFIWRIELRVVT
jgi:hypothetical protein